MDDLIKIAANGQWILEKAKPNSAEVDRMIQEFLAQKQKAAATPKAPPTQGKYSTAGLRPAQTNSGENPLYTKEQVAAIRAGIPEETVAKLPGTKSAAAGQRQQTAAKVTSDMDRQQAEADAKAKTTKDRKAAWEAGVAFLAQHGDAGYKALQAQMQQRKVLDAAHETGKMPVTPKPELMPPQREGSFHNEAFVSAGKIVNKGVGYTDKATGERRFTKVPQQEQHHWSWDHNNKKWNHVKTVVGPVINKG